jgi:hypothetical protein
MAALCTECRSQRLVSVLSHAADRHLVKMGNVEHCDYLPKDMGIGGGDDNHFTLCLNCGQVQGAWPVAETQIEKKKKEQEEKEKNELEKRKAVSVT